MPNLPKGSTGLIGLKALNPVTCARSGEGASCWQPRQMEISVAGSVTCQVYVSSFLGVWVEGFELPSP